MISNLIALLYILFWLSTLLVAIGLYKPWVVLWWKDQITRKLVLKYYGVLSLIAITLYLILSLIAQG